jgi:hypothetical protein
MQLRGRVRARVEPPPGADDDLLTPTLGGADAGAPVAGDRPWRLQSQFWIGFLGGSLAVSVVAAANAVRLGMPRSRVSLIASLAPVGLVASIGASLALGLGSGDAFRVSTRASGVVGYAIVYALQRGPDRIYRIHRAGAGDAYDSLWTIGLLATIVLGATQAVLTSYALDRW